MTSNAFGMVAGRVAAMGLGFVFWLLAAHAAPQAEVGLAAAVVSAMMLCTQLAQLGVGSAFISLLPGEQRAPGVLLDVALTLTATGSVAVALLFLLATKTWLPELARVGGSPGWAAAFVAMCFFGTLGIVLDQVNVGFGRGSQVVLRTATFGLITLVPLAVMLALDVPLSASQLIICWVIAGAGATAVGLRQLEGTVPGVSVGSERVRAGNRPGYRYRPRWERALGRRMVRVGAANHLLTLCERAPGLMLPIVVTELLSRQAAAVWYIVWMSAWVVFTAPVSMGIAQFAQTARSPAEAATSAAAALRTSLLYAGAGAAGLAVLAPHVLQVVGPRYAEAGVMPLRLLLIGVLPLSALSAYFAFCRATGRLSEAIAVGAVGGVATVVISAVASTRYELAGMALAWVAVQCVIALWAGGRLWAARS